MRLIEEKLNIPLDILIFINEWIRFERLNDGNMKEAVKLWFEDNEKCLFVYGHISKWNTSSVTNMSDLFRGRKEFNEDISKWDVSNVTNMSGMFNQTKLFNCDLSKWDVSNVANMCDMFYRATSFNSDLSNWDVRNVTNMYEMFYGAISFDRNTINNWNFRNPRLRERLFN